MTTQKNGATIPTNGKKVEEQKTVTPIATIVPVIYMNADSKKNLPALDERLQRLNELFDLQKKYNRLTASKQKLAEFKLKKGEENITISIEDSNSRNEFSTSNPVVVLEVLEFVSTKIDEGKKAIEPLLVW